jgi:hypothetical protein
MYQTAQQGQSRPAFRLGWPAAGQWACAFENHAFPTSAMQIDAIAFRRTVAVQERLDARAAAGKVLEHGRVQRQLVQRRPQIQRVAAGAATKAVVQILT